MNYLRSTTYGDITVDNDPTQAARSLGDLHVQVNQDGIPQCRVLVQIDNILQWTGAVRGHPHPYLPHYVLSDRNPFSPSWVTTPTYDIYFHPLRTHDQPFELIVGETHLARFGWFSCLHIAELLTIAAIMVFLAFYQDFIMECMPCAIGECAQMLASKWVEVSQPIQTRILDLILLQFWGFWMIALKELSKNLVGA